jgi:RHS repeat-associated protein
MATVRYTTLDGEIIAEKRSGVRRLYQPDPLGSTVGLVDGTQTQTDTFSYWPYGEERVRTGSTPAPFRSVGTAGYYLDSGSRSYVRARHLDRRVGRWITRDPLRRSRDVYGYARHRPVTISDPSGLLDNGGGESKDCGGGAKNPWQCCLRWNQLVRDIRKILGVPGGDKQKCDVCDRLDKFFDLKSFGTVCVWSQAPWMGDLCKVLEWYIKYCPEKPGKDGNSQIQKCVHQWAYGCITDDMAIGSINPINCNPFRTGGVR